MIVWFYTRNVLIACYAYMFATQNIPPLDEVSGFVQPFFSYLLVCVITLNYYWLFLMILWAGKFIKSGSTEDSHEVVNGKQKSI